jgi:hypothetical protein
MYAAYLYLLPALAAGRRHDAPGEHPAPPEDLLPLLPFPALPTDRGATPAPSGRPEAEASRRRGDLAPPLRAARTAR